jgi:hypothetical protein
MRRKVFGVIHSLMSNYICENELRYRPPGLSVRRRKKMKIEEGEFDESYK